MKQAKRFLVFLLAFVMVFSLLPAGAIRRNVSAAPGAIPIRTAQDLNNIRNNLSGSFVLMNDIDTRTLGSNWTPMGTQDAPFTGTFDGQGRNITLNVGSTSDPRDNQGLFGFISNATIKNVNIYGRVVGNNNIGGVAGNAQNSHILNVVNHAEVMGEWRVGGLVGYKTTPWSHSMTDGSNITRYSIIADSINRGNINGNQHVGGIVGLFVGRGTQEKAFAFINNCRNYGNITSDELTRVSGNIVFTTGFGGIAGEVSGGYRRNIQRSYGVQILDSVNNGLVDARFGVEAGGIVGRLHVNSAVRRSINNGRVSGGAAMPSGQMNGGVNIGGIVGVMCHGLHESLQVVQDSFNTGEVSGVRNVGGIAGAFSQTWNPVTASGSAIIERSFNTGTITSVYGTVGGILGLLNQSRMIVQNVYNTGAVIATGYKYTIPGSHRTTLIPGNQAGGIVGRIDTAGGIVRYTYNTGNVTAHGVVREATTRPLRGLPVHMFYWTYGGDRVGGIVGHTPGYNRFETLLWTHSFGPGPAVQDAMYRGVYNNVVLSHRIDGNTSSWVSGDVHRPVFENFTAIVGSTRYINYINNPAIATNYYPVFFNNISPNPALILSGVRNDACRTIPQRSDFHNQSTWEAMGFCFETVWRMPEDGPYRFPIFIWQDGPPLHPDELRLINSAQMLFEHLERGGGSYGGDGRNFEAFRRYNTNLAGHRIQTMQNAYRSGRFQEGTVNLSSALLGIAVGAGITSAAGVVLTTSQSIALLAADLAKMGINEFGDTGSGFYGISSTNNLIFTQAIWGQRMAAEALNRLGDYRTIILSSGGQISCHSLAYSFIVSYGRVRVGVDTTLLGSQYFMSNFNSDTASVLLQVGTRFILDSLEMMLLSSAGILSPVASHYLSIFTDNLFDGLFGTDSGPYVDAWRQRKGQIHEEINYMLYVR